MRGNRLPAMVDNNLVAVYEHNDRLAYKVMEQNNGCLALRWSQVLVYMI